MERKATITTQPFSAESMNATRLQSVRTRFLSRETWIGDASTSYSSLCMPRLNPWSKASRDPATAKDLPFYGLNDPLPVLLAAICGLQHALAMIGGVSGR